MTESNNSSPDTTEQFASTLSQLTEYRNYFTDNDKIKMLVDWLHEETQINKPTIRLAVKHIAPLIIASLAAVGGAIGESWRRKLLERLNQYTCYFNFTQRLLNTLKTRTDKSMEAALAIPSNENLEAIILNEPRWESLKPEQQGLIQLLLGQNAQIEGQDLLRQQLDQVIDHLQFDLDLKSPAYLSQDAKTASVGSSQWLTYTSRQAHLVGREKSMALLDDFIDQDDEFSWWVVSGVGGVGKSRLALEALLHHDYLWEVGFLNSCKLQKPDALSQWQPKQPTFIVIDYAAEYAHPIADWINHIIQHQADYDFPVRLLILERETKEQSWWKHLSSGSSDARRRQQKLFMPDPHELEPLTSSVHQADVLQNFLDSLKVDTQLPDLEDSFWQNLNTITDQGRPLFIGMAAVAIQKHGMHQIRQWHSQQDLLEEMLQREQDTIWQQQLSGADNQAQIMQLFALSTVVAGFDWEHQEDQLLDGLIDLDLLKNDYQAKQVKQKLITLAGHQGGYLQPDLLAEYFVLQHWADTDRPIKKLLLFAYQLAPENTLAFISRCAIDYPDHKSSWLWWDGLRQKLTAQDQLDDLYRTAFGIVNQLSLHGQYRINLQRWLPPLCKLENQEYQARAINSTGLQHHRLNQEDKALEHYQVALAIQQKTGHKSGKGSILNNISQVYEIHGDYKTALDYLQQSLSISQEIGDKSSESVALNNISQILKIDNEYETALEYLKQSLSITQDAEVGNKLDERVVLNNISQIYRALEDHKTARKYLKQSLSIAEEANDKLGMCVTLFNIGHIHWLYEEEQKAYSAWIRVYQIAKPIDLIQALVKLEYLAGQLGLEGGLEAWERLL